MVTKRRTTKNPHAVALGRLGGLAKSPAKTKAARENVLRRWARVAEQAATP